MPPEIVRFADVTYRPLMHAPLIAVSILIGVPSVLLFGISASLSGRIWAYSRVLSTAAGTVSSLAMTLGMLSHPGWDQAYQLARVSGRGAVIMAALQLGVALGPKPIALIFVGLSAVTGFIFRNEIVSIRQGDFRSADEIEKAAAQMKKDAAELRSRLKALKEAINSDAAWIRDQPKTFATQQEAEACSAAINAADARMKENKAAAEATMAEFERRHISR